MNLAINIAGNLLFVRLFGVAGIALSTSCVYFLSTAMVFVALRESTCRSARANSFGVQPARAA